MNPLIQHLKQYIDKVLGIKIRHEAWKESHYLPFFLRAEYEFHAISLMNTDVIALFDESNKEKTPAVIARHIQRIREKHDKPVVYVRESVTSYNRKRLIEHKVPFIVPHNQLYLPDLGLDLREYFRQVRSEKSWLSPASRAIFLYSLLHADPQPEFTTAQLAGHFGYSPMTFSRAFDQLADAQLGEITKKGKFRKLVFRKQKRELWHDALSRLRSPVIKTGWVPENAVPENAKESGITALARYSMLAAPENLEYAVSNKELKAYERDISRLTTPYPDSGSAKLEYWMYAPRMLSKQNHVDPLSLYLSLKDSEDERIQGGLDIMMEQLPW